jgi:hypothetical protein
MISALCGLIDINSGVNNKDYYYYYYYIDFNLIIIITQIL